MNGRRLVGGAGFCGDMRDFPAMEAEVPGGIGVGFRPVFMAEEDAGGEHEEDEEDRAHGIRAVVRVRVFCG